MSEFEGSPQTWPPLGLPVGSVRALLTMGVVGVAAVNLVRGHEIDVLWIEALLIALAHYFTSRRFVSLPPEVLEELESRGTLEKDWHPLYLPRNTIRTLIVAAFVALGVYLYQQQRLWEPQVVSLLGMVAAFLLGALVRTVGGWFRRRLNRTPSRWWGDTKAVVVLIAFGIAALPEVLDSPQSLAPEVRRVCLGLMLFYFGSR